MNICSCSNGCRLMTICDSHTQNHVNIQHQKYADDTQVFISVSPTDSAFSITRLESSLTDLYCWLSHNGLCLNPSKSDAILSGTQKRHHTCPPIASINIASSVVNLSTLSVNLVQTPNLQLHVQSPQIHTVDYRI